MRLAGLMTGLLVLGIFMIPGSYVENRGSGSKSKRQEAPSFASSGKRGAGLATLSGRVFGEDGRAISKASVSLAGSGFWPARVVETSSDGRFEWPAIPAGVYELRVSKGVLGAPTVEGLILDPGSHRAFALRLAAGRRLAGQVIDDTTGDGVPEAEVTVASGALGVHSRKTRTDAWGYFELDGVIGDDQALYVDAQGYVPAGPLLQPAATPLVIRLERAGRVQGQVVDPAGQPVAGSSIRVLAESRGATLGTTGSLGVTAGPVPPISAASLVDGVFVDQTTTGPDGRFALDKLRPGIYTVIAAHDDFAPARAERVRVARGRVGEALLLELRRGAELSGRVVDERGHALEGIPVQLRTPADPLPQMAITTDDGSFLFRGVRGEVTVAAAPHDMPHVRRTIAMAEDALVSIELMLPTTLFTLRGRVVDERGFGVSGALLTLSPQDPSGSFERSAKSDADGTFSVPALPATTYSLRADHPAFSTARMPAVDVQEEIRVVMATGVTFVGQVLDNWENEPLAGAIVRVNGPIDETARTRRDGTFVLRQLPTGTYDVSLSHPDFEPQQRKVVIEPPRYVDRPQDLGPVRLKPGGVVEGEVVDANGAPVPDAEVAWGEPPRWGLSVRTDPSGAFQLRGVPAGTEWITARHPRAGESWTSSSITVRPLEVSPGALIRLPDDVSE